MVFRHDGNPAAGNIVVIVTLSNEVVWVDMETENICAQRYVSDVNPLAVQIAAVKVTTIGGNPLRNRTSVPIHEGSRNSHEGLWSVQERDILHQITTMINKSKAFFCVCVCVKISLII